MSDPQLEDGYIRIANELYRAILRARFSKRELLIVLAVIDKTYGYGKKTDDITMTQLAEMTEMQRSHAGEAVSSLSDKKVFLIRDGRYGKVIGINKNYSKWLCSQIGTRPKSGNACSQIGKSGVPNRDTQETIPKDNTKKGFSSFDKFWAEYPKKKSRGQAEKAWAKLNPSEQLVAEIAAALKRAKTSGDWQEQGGKFIPYPASWLNAKGWLDEIAPDAPTGPRLRTVN